MKLGSEKPGRARDVLRLTSRGLLWRGRVMPAQIGRGGLSGTKQEGDGATPIGIMRITAMLWRADRLPRPAHWAQPIGPQNLWCDAPESAQYNQPVRAPFGPSHEKLRRADPLYDIILVTDWNRCPPHPGAGSAIFLHQRRRLGAPTAGCIALKRQDLIALAQSLRPGTILVVPPLASAHPRRHIQRAE